MKYLLPFDCENSIYHHNPQSAQFCCVKTNLNWSFSTSVRLSMECVLCSGLFPVSVRSFVPSLSSFCTAFVFWLLFRRHEQCRSRSETLTLAMVKFFKSSNFCTCCFSFFVFLSCADSDSCLRNWKHIGNINVIS